MGMIGGGPGAFIGPVHRIAAELDGQIAMVAGAFSSDPARSRAAGETYDIAPERRYPDYAAMFAAEALRSDPIEMVAVVTPNHLHLEAAEAALQAGVAVMSDKPATATLAQALRLRETVQGTGGLYALSYTYTGYPLVRQLREMIAGGALGSIRRVIVEYPQGWLAAPIEKDGSKQAGWRTDPSKAGVGGCIADIGVHAFNLAEFTTGLRVTQLCADLAAVVPGRLLDDDCTVLLRFDNGARGVLMASQVAIGELNGLTIRIYGDEASAAWRQESPNALTLHHLDGRTELLRTGDAGLLPAAVSATRLPGGHPEGYLEAFGNIYRDFAARLRGDAGGFVQSIDEGVRSMAFIETAVRASRDDLGWVDLGINGVAA